MADAMSVTPHPDPPLDIANASERPRAGRGRWLRWLIAGVFALLVIGLTGTSIAIWVLLGHLNDVVAMRDEETIVSIRLIDGVTQMGSLFSGYKQVSDTPEGAAFREQLLENIEQGIRATDQSHFEEFLQAPGIEAFLLRAYGCMLLDLGETERGVEVFELAGGIWPKPGPFNADGESLSSIPDEQLPGVQREFREKLAQGYLQLNRPEDAIPILEGLDEDYSLPFGHDPTSRLLVASDLADAYHAAGRSDEAAMHLEKAYQEALEMPGDPLETALWLVAIKRAQIRIDQEHWEVASEILEELLRHPADAPMDAVEKRIASLTLLVWCYHALERFDDHLELLEEHAAWLESDPVHFDERAIALRQGLAWRYQLQGRTAEAVSLYRQVFLSWQFVRELDDPLYDNLVFSLAACHASLNQNSEAIQSCRTLCEMRESELGPAHPATLIAVEELALLAFLWGQHDVAIEAAEQAAARQIDRHGETHWETWRSRAILAASLASLDRDDEAIAMLEPLAHPTEIPEDVPNQVAARALFLMGQALFALDRRDEALRISERAFAALENAGFQDTYALDFTSLLAFEYAELHRFDKVESVVRRFLERRRPLPSPPGQNELVLRLTLVWSLLEQDQDAEALQAIGPLIEGHGQLDAPMLQALTQALMGRLHANRMSKENAIESLEEGYTSALRHLKSSQDFLPRGRLSRPILLGALDALIECCESLDRLDEAQRWREERDRLLSWSPRPKET